MACVGAASVLEVVSKGSHCVGATVCGCEVTLHAAPRWINMMCVGDVVTLHNPTLRVLESEMHVYVNEQSGGFIFIQAAQHRGKIQSAEVFAGISGWSRAGSIVREEIGYFVEKDTMTAENCAKQHRCKVHSPADFIELALMNQLPRKAVLLGDADSPDTWAALCLANVGEHHGLSTMSTMVQQGVLFWTQFAGRTVTTKFGKMVWKD